MTKHLLMVALLLLAHAKAHAQTCGVREPWATQHFDGFFSQVLPCTGEFIDDVWTRFNLDQDEWQQFGVVEGGCNYNMPLGRTISALEVMAFSGTPNPHCDWENDLVLDWAYCFSGNAMAELTPVCDGGGMAATTYPAIQLDNRTELHKPFFYDSDVPRRAATLFHEARHADGWCIHSGACAAGQNACDRTFEDGCVGVASSSGKGAYAWTVIYLQRYLLNSRPELFDQVIHERVRQSANVVLGRNFESDPCFRITGINGAMSMGVDLDGKVIQSCLTEPL